MKAHIGVDAESGLVHTVIGTPANVYDITQAGALLYGGEMAAFGDTDYRGMGKRQEAQGPTWFVAMQPCKRRVLDTSKKWARLLERAEQLKASKGATSSTRFASSSSNSVMPRCVSAGWPRTPRGWRCCSR
jgi:transposase, IS5 family